MITRRSVLFMGLAIAFAGLCSGGCQDVERQARQPERWVDVGKVRVPVPPGCEVLDASSLEDLRAKVGAQAVARIRSGRDGWTAHIYVWDRREFADDDVRRKQIGLCVAEIVGVPRKYHFSEGVARVDVGPYTSDGDGTGGKRIVEIYIVRRYLMQLLLQYEGTLPSEAIEHLVGGSREEEDVAGAGAEA